MASRGHVQQLHIDVSPTVFLSADGLVVSMLENTRAVDASRLGLRPLLIYGLFDEPTVRSEPSHIRCDWHIQCAEIDKPWDLVEYLKSAWDRAGTRPDVLKIGGRVVELFPRAVTLIEALDVSAQQTHTSDRSYNIQQSWARQRLNSAIYLSGWRKPRETYTAQVEARTLGWLNTWAQKAAMLVPYGQTPPPALTLPVDPCARMRLDSFPYQTKLPPRSDAAITADWQRSELLQTKKYAGNEIEVDALTQETVDGILDERELVSLFLDNYPMSRADVAHAVGVSTMELGWFLSGKKGLDRATWFSLMTLFGLEPDPHFEYDDGSRDYRPVESYAFTCGRQTAKRFAAIYDLLSHGGDCQFSYEVTPASGAADPSFRFLLLRPYAGTTLIAAFPRGTEIAARVLEDNLLINFCGPAVIATEVYRLVVQAWVAVQANPLRMFELMRMFNRAVPSIDFDEGRQLRPPH